MPRVASDTRLPAARAVLGVVHEDAALDIYAEEELHALSEAADAVPVGVIHQRVDRPTTATYIGSGKVQEVHTAAVDATRCACSRGGARRPEPTYYSQSTSSMLTVSKTGGGSCCGQEHKSSGGPSNHPAPL